MNGDVLRQTIYKCDLCNREFGSLRGLDALKPYVRELVREELKAIIGSKI